ncbi:carbohydrate kinase family protein [Desulfonatronospira sp. MSAO_Bac3]|uniref:carbohydrate kinase family protein n=1 Tax=Desulfonatronospira sp. MSAO_Bac3 TaxID=2293857 RepID=UPI000FF6983C|nr:carbohydrate kinase family protein [Desulfonatronospira sp. MSAO_Bac3]RQD74855.1 MAG: carbohydrate kinase family protein [Desulfonatronospira sp. MSAO_Bac3]
MKILVSGSVAYDRIMPFPGKFADHIMPDKIHILNVCFLVDGLIEKFGGTAGNIAFTLKLLGEDPEILATVGKDFGNYEAWMQKHGISRESIRVMEEDLTASAYITTDKSDNQITGFNPAAMNHSSQFNFDRIAPEDTLAIVSPGNLDDMYNYSRKYQEKKVRYIFDPGQNIPAFSGEKMLDMISGSYILIANDYELEMIMKNTGKSKAELLEYTENIITTLGEHGCSVLNGGDDAVLPAARVSQVVDPTGAGDGFRAGLIKGLADGRSVSEAAKVGLTSAAYAVEHHGTQEHYFTPEEFWKRYKDNFE